jgi:hypothetical protein
MAYFFLQVDGSIMESQALPFPAAPKPTEVSTSGGGTSRQEFEDVATIYVDTDGSAATGWKFLSNFGVDAIITVQGSGGGAGRAPRLGDTEVSVWSGAGQRFSSAGGNLQVGFDSQRMEAGVPFSQLCGGPCLAAKYMFRLSNPSGQSDETAVRDGVNRGGGEFLLADEARTRTRNAFQGDENVAVLSLSVASPSSNTLTAYIRSVSVALEGATPQQITTIGLYRDAGVLGEFDQADVTGAPMATSQLAANGNAYLAFATPFELAPGESLSVFVTISIARKAEVPAFVNISVGSQSGIEAVGISSVRYNFAAPEPVELHSYIPPQYRAVTDLLINEFNFLEDWVEVYDTSQSSGVSLTSPQVSLRVQGFDDDLTEVSNHWYPFAGSTSGEGFATVDADISYSTGTITYRARLSCSTCGGGGSNTTIGNWITLPTSSAREAYGRFPDGSNSWTDTDNNTEANNNTIPEFQDIFVPVLGVTFVALLRRHRRASTQGGEPEPAFP